ncbi:helix-turn-helix transcriptional regulator [Amedibacillus sp. YH-ame6]
MKNIKIKIARMELDMSQEELAEKVGATRQTIGLIEAGRYNPSIKLCINICIALHKRLDELFWDETYEKEEL